MHVDGLCSAALSENVDGKKVKDPPVGPPSPTLPRFILGGCVKCGTTLIENKILEHPQVVPARPDKVSAKQPCFFDLLWREDIPAKDQVIAFIIFLPETF